MYTTLSGQIAVAKQIDMIANNIANLNTTGFKSERPIFEKTLAAEGGLLSSSLKKDIAPASPWESESYTGFKGSYADLTQGSIENTGNPLDVALQGKGFFVVQSTDGERYTRAGSFKLDATGRLVTQDGLPVMGQGGEIVLGNGEVTFTADGGVKLNGQSAGKLRVVDLSAASLEREPGQRFKIADGAASDIEKPSMVGGAIEASNVNAVRELADMILASRLFEGFKNVQQTEAQLDQQRNEKLGSIQG